MLSAAKEKLKDDIRQTITEELDSIKHTQIELSREKLRSEQLFRTILRCEQRRSRRNALDQFNSNTYKHQQLQSLNVEDYEKQGEYKKDMEDIIEHLETKKIENKRSTIDTQEESLKEEPVCMSEVGQTIELAQSVRLQVIHDYYQRQEAGLILKQIKGLEKSLVQQDAEIAYLQAEQQATNYLQHLYQSCAITKSKFNKVNN